MKKITYLGSFERVHRPRLEMSGFRKKEDQLYIFQLDIRM